LEQTWWSTSMRRRCQDLTHMSCPWETIFGTPLRRSLFLMGRRWNKTHCFRQSMSVSRSMDDFVCDTLTQWQLTDLIDRFK
ncbi:hypothetical protein KUCAC02_035717, partial [Chaenocephalus aceratus]